MVEYAARLGRLSAEQIQAALTRFELGTFIRAAPVPVGLGGQNLFVESTAGSFVLRGNPLFPGQLAKERFFASLLHEQVSIPVPWPYYHDPTVDIFGWSYALMPRLAGLHVADPAMPAVAEPADPVGLAEALAEGLAALHTPRWTEPGEYEPETDTIAPLAVPFGTWIIENVWTKIRRAEVAGERLAEADLTWVQSLLDEAEPALAEPFEPGFTMHDYQITNLVFARADGRWHVCGIFDFVEAGIGDSEADLPRPLRMLALRDETLARTFLRRYVALSPPRPGFAERYAVYALDDLLIGWVYARRMGYRDRNKSFRELSEPFTSAVERLL